MMPTTTDPYAEREQRANTLGWTFVGDQHCPRRLVGKRCRTGYPDRLTGTPEMCWCARSGQIYGGLNDHGATWRDGDGRQFVLWEPYGAHGDAVAELVAIARQDGLSVDICPSVWCPPYTIGIRFTAHVFATNTKSSVPQ
jgi:hypothetical protein